MCDMCLIVERKIGNVFGDWYLAQATQGSSTAGMNVNDYCLTQGMYATFVFPIAPIPDPHFMFTDEQYEELTEEEYDQGDPFVQLVELTEPSLVCRPEVGYELYAAALGAGYNPEVHGWRFAAWLTHIMGVVFEQYRTNSIPLSD